MKRLIMIALVTMMLLTLMATSVLAAEGTMTAEANTWKTGIGYTTRAASGSFWKAAYKSGPVSSIQCYLYRKGGDRCTKIISLAKSSNPTTGLNYLSGQAVTGAQYKFNFRVQLAGSIRTISIRDVPLRRRAIALLRDF